MKKMHPAWRMLAGCCAMTFVGLGIVNSCAGIFLTPVSEELGVGVGSLSLYMTVQGVTNVLSVLLVSRVLARFRLSVVASLSALAICTAFGAMACYHHVFLWYVSGAVIGFAMPYCGVPVAPIIISNWFRKKEGMAMGVVMAFSGVGGTILNPVISAIMEHFGWRQAYLAVGVIGAAVVLPFTLFVLRLKPEEKGLLPYGAEKEAGKRAVDIRIPTGEFFRQKNRRARFGALFLAVLFMGGYNAIVQHMSGFNLNSGLSYASAGMILSILMFAMMIGKVLLGVVIDRFGLKPAMLSTASICIGGLLILMASAALSVRLIGAALFGLTAALVTVLPAIATKQAFGAANYDSIYPAVTIASCIGCNFSVPLLGFLYDATGSYGLGFGLLAGLIGAAVVFYLIALRQDENKSQTIQAETG
ncbi:MFS transporter [Cuneatibacter sp. NSJ-177]|uniref:MFS transporter n=1 Tax=Cuneatibacter sp. NSJ-177 TaxID=2931401 RepID=UPI001FD30413|nr:MFS transporter [Cuneatibacter sp. NSJ-177]MCJ7837517.1 MFS transporter [Cuneatibacter sp. NSJ-177]